MRPFKLSRSALFRLCLAVAPASAAIACGAGDHSSTSDDDVTSVENTNVKSQAIGNCWLYATAGWVESLHKGATSRDIDVSEGYWNYWYWYEEITGGDISLDSALENGRIGEGGWWGVGAELIQRYGWMYEGDFIPAADAKAKRHEDALAVINASLASGPLSSPGARRDPKTVRAELNRAWGIDPSVVQDLEQQFPVVPARASSAPPPPAEDGGFDSGVPAAPPLPDAPLPLVSITDRAAGGSLGLTRLHAPQELPVVAADGVASVTLADVVGKKAPGSSVGDGVRVGDEAWSEIKYTWAAEDAPRRNAMLKNVQNALNHRLAVPLGWTVANSEKQGVYLKDGVTDWNIAGLHESILVDYEVENVPGFGTLQVDVRETRPEALEATLDDAAKLTFFRIKNSWGTDPVWTPEEMRQYGIAPDQDSGAASKPNYLPSKPGYNDLFVDYLDLPYSANKENGHMMLRMALPTKLRFPIPAAATPAVPDAGVSSDAGSGEGGAGKK